VRIIYCIVCTVRWSTVIPIPDGFRYRIPGCFRATFKTCVCPTINLQHPVCPQTTQSIFPIQYKDT